MHHQIEKTSKIEDFEKSYPKLVLYLIRICLIHLKDLVTYFLYIWSDEGFNRILVDANTLAEELEIERNFTDPYIIRPRRKIKH